MWSHFIVAAVLCLANAFGFFEGMLYVTAPVSGALIILWFLYNMMQYQERQASSSAGLYQPRSLLMTVRRQAVVGTQSRHDAVSQRRFWAVTVAVVREAIRSRPTRQQQQPREKNPV
jgi:hypothetical protein